MAKQTGVIKIRGTLDDFCFYRSGGEYYVRTKSSLKGERVKHDPAFAETMRYAGMFGRASRLSSNIYKTIPKEQRKPIFFRQLTATAMCLLKEHVPEELVQVRLEQRLAELMQASPEKR